MIKSKPQFRICEPLSQRVNQQPIEQSSCKLIKLLQDKLSNVKSRYHNKLNTQTLQKRKESYLNSQFNRRKAHLLEITFENQRLYKRINSQRSFYSNKQLNKSFQQHTQHEKRILKSKQQKRNRTPLNSQRGKSAFGTRRFSQLKQYQSFKQMPTQCLRNSQANLIQGFKKLFFKMSKQKQNTTKQLTKKMKPKSLNIRENYEQPISKDHLFEINNQQTSTYFNIKRNGRKKIMIL